MKKKLSILVVFLGVILSSSSTSVFGFAYVSKGGGMVFPGHMCRYYGPLGSDNFFNPSGEGGTGIRNTSNKTQIVACPIPKEYWKDTKTAFIIMNTSQDVCVLSSRGDWGRMSAGWYNVQSIHKHGGFERYTHVWGAGDTWYDTSFDILSFYCKVPPGKSIYSYYLRHK